MLNMASVNHQILSLIAEFSCLQDGVERLKRRKKVEKKVKRIGKVRTRHVYSSPSGSATEVSRTYPL